MNTHLNSSTAPKVAFGERIDLTLLPYLNDETINMFDYYCEVHKTVIAYVIKNTNIQHLILDNKEYSRNKQEFEVRNKAYNEALVDVIWELYNQIRYTNLKITLLNQSNISYYKAFEDTIANDGIDVQILNKHDFVVLSGDEAHIHGIELSRRLLNDEYLAVINLSTAYFVEGIFVGEMDGGEEQQIINQMNVCLSYDVRYLICPESINVKFLSHNPEDNEINQHLEECLTIFGNTHDNISIDNLKEFERIAVNLLDKIKVLKRSDVYLNQTRRTVMELKKILERYVKIDNLNTINGIVQLLNQVIRLVDELNVKHIPKNKLYSKQTDRDVKYSNMVDFVNKFLPYYRDNATRHYEINLPVEYMTLNQLSLNPNKTVESINLDCREALLTYCVNTPNINKHHQNLLLLWNNMNSQYKIILDNNICNLNTALLEVDDIALIRITEYNIFYKNSDNQRQSLGVLSFVDTFKLEMVNNDLSIIKINLSDVNIKYAGLIMKYQQEIKDKIDQNHLFTETDICRYLSVQELINAIVVENTNFLNFSDLLKLACIVVLPDELKARLIIHQAAYICKRIDAYSGILMCGIDFYQSLPAAYKTNICKIKIQEYTKNLNTSWDHQVDKILFLKDNGIIVENFLPAQFFEIWFFNINKAQKQIDTMVTRISDVELKKYLFLQRGYNTIVDLKTQFLNFENVIKFNNMDLEENIKALLVIHQAAYVYQTSVIANNDNVIVCGICFYTSLPEKYKSKECKEIIMSYVDKLKNNIKLSEVFFVKKEKLGGGAFLPYNFFIPWMPDDYDIQ